MCTLVRNCPNPGFNVDLPTGQTVNACRGHYRAVWEQELKSEHGDQIQKVPLSAAVTATDYAVTLVAIQNDRNYLTKSLIFTAYKANATGTPLRLLRNKVAREVIKKSSGMTEAEFKTAKRTSPKNADGDPTMGHTYVILQALNGASPKAAYSFGYFPVKSGITNPDGHVRLTDEQRRSVSYAVSKADWAKALNEVFTWHWDHITGAQVYNLMGRNCTLFARAVVKAAGHKFLGDTILTMTSQGVSQAYTPNRCFKALGKKGRHVQWDTGTGAGAPMAMGPASASELHGLMFNGDDD